MQQKLVKLSFVIFFSAALYAERREADKSHLQICIFYEPAFFYIVPSRNIFSHHGNVEYIMPVFVSQHINGVGIVIGKHLRGVKFLYQWGKLDFNFYPRIRDAAWISVMNFSAFTICFFHCKSIFKLIKGKFALICGFINCRPFRYSNLIGYSTGLQAGIEYKFPKEPLIINLNCTYKNVHAKNWKEKEELHFDAFILSITFGIVLHSWRG